jgi:hypothetical protein
MIGFTHVPATNILTTIRQAYKYSHYYSNHKQHTRLGWGLNLEMSPHHLMEKPPDEKRLARKNPPYMFSNYM